jgi:hypothetical protein
MAACAYMNPETLFFECFWECFFHTFCIYDNLRYRFNSLWCWIFVTVKIILKSDVETFSQKFLYSAKIYQQLRFLYCFHDKIRIYFMYFIVQISSFVHLFTLKIVFRWSPPPPRTPHQGSALDLLAALCGPQTPRRKFCLYFVLYLATPLQRNKCLFNCFSIYARVVSLCVLFWNYYNWEHILVLSTHPIKLW